MEGYFVLASAGNNVIASNVTIASTTSSSVRVKAWSGYTGTDGTRFKRSEWTDGFIIN
jgi:hypothetical protein